MAHVAIGSTLHVLTIEHRHGANVHVHATEAGANATLHKYVCNWWQDAVVRQGVGVMPSDPQEAIDVYFDAMQHSEYYTLTETTLES